MPLSTSARHELSFVAETVYGTTPASPVFKRLGFTGTTLALTKGVIESEKIRQDRQVEDVRSGQRQVAGDITVELAASAFDDFLQAVICGTWTSDVLVPGVVRRSFSMLRHFSDITAAGSLPFHIYRGVELNTFSVSVQPEGFVTATFGTMGQDMALSQTAPTGTTYTAAPTTKAFDSFRGSVNIDGVDSGIVTELSLTVENGLEPRFTVFSALSSQPKIGRTRVTGQLTLYFENSALLTAYLNDTNVSLEFTLLDELNNSLNFEMPNIKLTGGQADVSGESDITVPVSFTALYETGSQALTITRLLD